MYGGQDHAGGARGHDDFKARPRRPRQSSPIPNSGLFLLLNFTRFCFFFVRKARDLSGHMPVFSSPEFGSFLSRIRVLSSQFLHMTDASRNLRTPSIRFLLCYINSSEFWRFLFFKFSGFRIFFPPFRHHYPPLFRMACGTATKKKTRRWSFVTCRERQYWTTVETPPPS